jgi:hypothetical protein
VRLHPGGLGREVGQFPVPAGRVDEGQRATLGEGVVLQPGQQAGRYRARVERTTVGVPVRQCRQHPAFRRGDRRLRAEGHPGQQPGLGRLGKQAHRGQVAQPAHREPEPEQRRAAGDQHLPAATVLA